MDSIWAPTSIEIQKLSTPTIFTTWLYNTTLAKELERDKLEKVKIEQLEKEKLEISKTIKQQFILLNQIYKPSHEIRVNNDGSICKFLS